MRGPTRTRSGVQHLAGHDLALAVLPTVFDALGVPEVKLEPGSMLVVHHRKGKVVASEVLGA